MSEIMECDWLKKNLGKNSKLDGRSSKNLAEYLTNMKKFKVQN